MGKNIERKKFRRLDSADSISSGLNITLISIRLAMEAEDDLWKMLVKSVSEQIEEYKTIKNDIMRKSDNE